MAESTASASVKAEKLQDFLLALVTSKGSIGSNLGKELLADNLTFITKSQLPESSIDYAKFSLLLSGGQRSGGFRLNLLYDGEVLLKGCQEEDREWALNGLLDASADMVSKLLD